MCEGIPARSRQKDHTGPGRGVSHITYARLFLLRLVVADCNSREEGGGETPSGVVGDAVQMTEQRRKGCKEICGCGFCVLRASGKGFLSPLFFFFSRATFALAAQRRPRTTIMIITRAQYPCMNRTRVRYRVHVHVTCTVRVICVFRSRALVRSTRRIISACAAAEVAPNCNSSTDRFGAAALLPPCLSFMFFFPSYSHISTRRSSCPSPIPIPTPLSLLRDFRPHSAYRASRTCRVIPGNFRNWNCSRNPRAGSSPVMCLFTL